MRFASRGLAPCIGILVAIGLIACSLRPHDLTTPIRGTISAERLLTWLPADTETLFVANGPFWMSNFQIGGDIYKNHDVTREELEKNFEGMTLALFVGRNQLLEKHLRGKKVLFALEASRHFRPPTNLGEAPFEGCSIAIFQGDLEDQRDSFMKEASQTAVRTEEIGGQKVVMFAERSEEDVWQSFVVFPQKGVVVATTNEQFLNEVLSRMSNGTREAFPATLPEWKYVNTGAQFWGIRHFDKGQSEYDPTSPYGGRKAANVPDDGAIGLTYEYGTKRALGATVTYLSSSDAMNLHDVEENRFSSSVEPDPGDTAELRIQRQTLAPGIVQSRYDLSHSGPLGWFMFILAGSMGHAIYL